MKRHRMAEAALAYLCLGGVISSIYAASPASQSSQSKSQSVASSSITGTVTAVDIEALSPYVTVVDSNGKTSTVSVDASTVVTKQNHDGALSDLRPGQQAQISGRYMTHVGRFIARSIPITQEPIQTTSSSVQPTAASSTKTKSTPTVLRSSSGSGVEKQQKSTNSSSASPTHSTSHK